jgi:hypothetical protein
MRDDIDEVRLTRLIDALSRPIKPLDWREFHFFKDLGLNRGDSIATRICLDYELARESLGVLRFVKVLSQQRRLEEVNAAKRFNSRYVPVRFGDAPTDPNIPKWADIDILEEGHSLWVPAACVSASWFPKPWLAGPLNERRSIVKQLTPVYAVRPITALPFPLEEQTANSLVLAARSDGNTTLHVIAVNGEQTRAALLKAFDSWLHRQKNITGKASRRGKDKFAAALTD